MYQDESSDKQVTTLLCLFCFAQVSAPLILARPGSQSVGTIEEAGGRRAGSGTSGISEKRDDSRPSSLTEWLEQAALISEEEFPIFFKKKNRSTHAV